jgi:predicted PolB exonuclease-like 3'-5' exonuclease
MTAWAGGTNRISMDELCQILGIQGKDGFDGSQVAAAWSAGEHDKIAEYCRDDVYRTREIHKRFLQAGL